MVYVNVFNRNRIFAYCGEKGHQNHYHAPDENGAVGKIYVLEFGQVEK